MVVLRWETRADIQQMERAELTVGPIHPCSPSCGDPSSDWTVPCVARVPAFAFISYILSTNFLCASAS